MAMIRDLSRAQLAFEVEGADPDQFELVRYSGNEGLCRLYRFELDLSCDLEVDFASVVGKSAVLSINTASGEKWFHGVVGRFELTGESQDRFYYRADLVPTIWLLTHRYKSRIFSNKTTQEIVSDILEKGGIATDRFRFELKRQYKPREYCVQYRETDYNFISRLLEEEGIWWCFEQSKDGHVLVMADSPDSYRPIEGESEIPYHPPTGMNVEEEHVFRFRIGQSVRPGGVVLSDFDFENPKLNLKSQASAGRDSGLEFSDYPGEFKTQAEGDELAKVRTEEFEATRVQAVGQSNCPRLCPGKTFELVEHSSDSLNRGYLVTGILHQGKQTVSKTWADGNGRIGLVDASIQQSLIAARQNEDPAVRSLATALLQLLARLQASDPTSHRVLSEWLYHAGQVSRDLSSIAAALGNNPMEALAPAGNLDESRLRSVLDWEVPVYECRFDAIPDDVSFRPPRVTPWPVARGSQTARVVGPKGEEIYTDKYGRVKVQFNWDREGKFDENSSCWIRVSQGLAGGTYGFMFIPRVGQEVVVDFLEGNPDQPLIVGRVYNADQMPPYTLPDEKTKSVIKTNSTKGGGGTNEIRFEDLKDKEQILVYAQKDMHVRVKNDLVENIERDAHHTIDGECTGLVKKCQSHEVKLDLSEKVGGKKSLLVTGDVAEDFKARHSEKVGSAYYLKAGTSVVIEGGTDVTLKVGGNFVKIDSGGVTILGTMVKINSGGSPGSGSLVALKNPATPLVADKVLPGKDVTYSGGEELVENETSPEVTGHEFKTSWIEIELVDEAGMPVAGETYQIIGPDGELISQGITGHDGIANILVPEEGTCQIGFPNLDAEAWEKIG